MSKKPSLAAALQSYNRAPAPVEVPSRVAHARPDDSADKPLRLLPPSRAGKKAITCYFDPAVSKQLRQIALDRDVSLQDLFAEALNDLFQKYKKPTLA